METEAAVREFQRIFNLTPDGIVGKATWYKIKKTYNGVKGLSELYSEGISFDEAQRQFSRQLQLGDTGNPVRVAQYYLAIISYFDDQIPQVLIDGNFDENTLNGVQAFQREYGLDPTGVIDRETWNRMMQVYADTIASVPPETLEGSRGDLSGRFLTLGMQGDDVRQLQIFLQEAAARHSFIPSVEATGTFDQATEDAVKAVQDNQGLEGNGAVGPITWNRIVRLARR